MASVTILLLAIFLAFLIYALFTQWSKTSAEQSIPKRVLAAMGAAVAALAAAIVSWAQGLGS